jgi:transposase InsO family protein
LGCGASRIAEIAALLEPDVLRGYPIRQWVLSVNLHLKPHPPWFNLGCKLTCFLFNSLTQAREMADSRMVDSNYERPHESLNDLPPKEYERLDQESTLEV